MTYLITFSCYGQRLHGDERGSVDHEHSIYKGPVVPENAGLWQAERKALKEAPFFMDTSLRLIVLESVKQVCAHRYWTLYAAHVRSTHVHAVVKAEAKPEKVMNDLKAYASRSLNQAGQRRKRWARHGSTRWLHTQKSIHDAIEYVLESQGTEMAAFNAALA